MRDELGDDYARAVAHNEVITQHPKNGLEPSPNKKITVNLTYYTNSYKVTAIENTAWYQPGNWLTPQIVADLCARPNWDVKIVDNNVWATIMNIVSKIPL